MSNLHDFDISIFIYSKYVSAQNTSLNETFMDEKIYSAPGTVAVDVFVLEGIKNYEVDSHSNGQEENFELEAHLKKYRAGNEPQYTAVSIIL